MQTQRLPRFWIVAESLQLLLWGTWFYVMHPWHQCHLLPALATIGVYGMNEWTNVRVTSHNLSSGKTTSLLASILYGCENSSPDLLESPPVSQGDRAGGEKMLRPYFQNLASCAKTSRLPTSKTHPFHHWLGTSPACLQGRIFHQLFKLGVKTAITLQRSVFCRPTNSFALLWFCKMGPGLDQVTHCLIWAFPTN